MADEEEEEEEEIKFDLNTMSGYEMIEFEEVTGLTLAEASAAMASGNPPGKATLGVTYLFRRRTNPELTWDAHCKDDISVSVKFEESDPKS